MQTVHANEQNVLDMVSFAEVIVGTCRRRDSCANKDEGQSDCKNSLFQRNLLYGTQIETAVARKD
jgi:hypothetical protein